MTGPVAHRVELGKDNLRIFRCKFRGQPYVFRELNGEEVCQLAEWKGPSEERKGIATGAFSMVGPEGERLFVSFDEALDWARAQPSVVLSTVINLGGQLVNEPGELDPE